MSTNREHIDRRLFLQILGGATVTAAATGSVSASTDDETSAYGVGGYGDEAYGRDDGADDDETSGPTIESLDVDAHRSSIWAHVSLEWSVSSDSGLDTCRTELFLDGEVVDLEKTSLGGQTDADGDHRVRHVDLDGDGSYEMVFTVTDENGNTTTATEAVE